MRLCAWSVLHAAKESCGQGGEPGANPSLLSCLLRSQESHKPVMLVVVSFLPVPVMLVVAYGIWKKKHMGSEYSHS